MITCKDCIYWMKGHGFRDETDEPPWQCKAPRRFHGYQMPEDFPDDGFLVESDEGWSLVTGPDFGCIHGKESGNELLIGVAGEEIKAGDLISFHKDGRLYKVKLDETGNPRSVVE